MYKLEGQMLKQVAVIPINYVQLFKAKHAKVSFMYRYYFILLVTYNIKMYPDRYRRKQASL
jgi:hypothetical protein